jgi:hypothetical protein
MRLMKYPGGNKKKYGTKEEKGRDEDDLSLQLANESADFIGRKMGVPFDFHQ